MVPSAEQQDEAQIEDGLVSKEQQSVAHSQAVQETLPSRVRGEITTAAADDPQPEEAVIEQPLALESTAQEDSKRLALAPPSALGVSGEQGQSTTDRQDTMLAATNAPVSAAVAISDSAQHITAASGVPTLQALPEAAAAASAQPPAATTLPDAVAEPDDEDKAVQASAAAVPNAGDEAVAGMPPENFTKGEAATSAVRPPAAEPIELQASHANETEEIPSDRDPINQHEPAQGSSGGSESRAAASAPAALDVAQAASLTAAAQEMPEAVKALQIAAEPSSMPQPDSLASTGLPAASPWQHQSQTQIPAPSSGAYLTHTGLPIYQHGWLPLLATNLPPSSDQPGGITPSLAPSAATSSAQPYRHTPAMSIALQAGMNFLPGNSQPTAFGGSGQQQIHTYLSSSQQPPAQNLSSNPTSSGGGNSTGNSSFLFQKMRHTGGLAEILAKVGQPVSRTPPPPQPQQSEVAEQPSSLPAADAQHMTSAAAEHAEPVRQPSQPPQSEALPALRSLPQSSISQLEPSAEPQAILEAERQPRQAELQPLPEVLAPQTETTVPESRAAHGDAAEASAEPSLGVKRKAGELTATSNAEQLKTERNDLTEALQDPADTQRDLSAAMKSRKVQPYIMH